MTPTGPGLEPSVPAKTGPRRGFPAWPLLVAAVVEGVSLAALLINLAAGDNQGIAAAVGPLHGTAYLISIALTWAGGYPRRARLLALIPGIGGLLATRAGTSNLP